MATAAAIVDCQPSHGTVTLLFSLSPDNAVLISPSHETFMSLSFICITFNGSLRLNLQISGSMVKIRENKHKTDSR